MTFSENHKWQPCKQGNGHGNTEESVPDKGTASAKTLRWDSAWLVSRTARGFIRLERETRRR